MPQLSPAHSRALAGLRDRPSVARLTARELLALTDDAAEALVRQASSEEPLNLAARVAMMDPTR